MKLYRVTEKPITLPKGSRVVLTKAQIAPRQHNLKAVDQKTGAVEALVALDFKVGEVIGLDSLPKGMAGRLAPIAAEKAA